MSADAYFQSAAPTPWTILGMRLRPFALGHLLLLHRIESSFVTQSAPTFEDLASAVLICSQSYQDALGSFSDPDLPTFQRRWIKRITKPHWWSSPKPIDLFQKAKDFEAYMLEGSEIPGYKQEVKNTVSLNAPLVQIVKIELMSRMHFREDEILNRGWWLCLWDYIMLKIMDGRAQPIDNEAVHAAMEAGARVAKMIAEGKWPS